MLNRIFCIARNACYLSLALLPLILLALPYWTTAQAAPNSQTEPTWCFSRIEDQKRNVVFHLAHRQGQTPEDIIDAYHMPSGWVAGLSAPVCFADWEEGETYLGQLRLTLMPSKTQAAFDEEMQAHSGKPWVTPLDRPKLEESAPTIPMPEVWCYTLFTNAVKDAGIYIGHYPGISPEEMASEGEKLPPDIDYSRAERTECFTSWQESVRFRNMVITMTSVTILPDEYPFAEILSREYGHAYPVDQFALTPTAVPAASTLLDTNTRAVWCVTIFTGAYDSKAVFGHYPGEPLETVFARAPAPDWVKEAVTNLAATEETSCYPSWEAAFNGLIIGLRRNYAQYLPQNPGEGDYEAVILRHYLGTEWQRYRRSELGAAETPDPLTLTRVAPTPTVTPSPTLTPTTDPRTVNRDDAVWCFTLVDDLAHEVVFVMSHPSAMSYAELRDLYRLPPGLLSQPDRETYCYEDWRQAAVTAIAMVFPINILYLQTRGQADEYSPEYQQSLLEQGLGQLGVVPLGPLNTLLLERYRNSEYLPDQPVWCYSYFTGIEATGGVYLGHYVDQGDEAILADHGLDPAGGWRRSPPDTRCFASWLETANFREQITGERVTYNQSDLRLREQHVAALLPLMRAPHPVNAPQPTPTVPVPTSTPTRTPTLTPTATRAPAGAALLGENIRAVWCFTVFTGAQGSTATFGHYPGEPLEVVFARVAAPDWVMTAAQNQAATEETSCYPTWEAAFGGMWIGQQRNLSERLPENPTEADYETVILETYLGTDWQKLRRPELSSADSATEEAPQESGPVWCRYTIANGQNASTSLVGAYPGMTVEEVLTLTSGFTYLLKQEPVIQGVDCFTSWEAAIDASFQDWRLFDGEALPTELGEGDYEVLFLRYTFGADWREQQRAEFSASAPPNPLTLEFIEGMDQ